MNFCRVGSNPTLLVEDGGTGGSDFLADAGLFILDRFIK